MNYRNLTNQELLHFAEQDPRYQFDALYTEPVARVTGAPPNAGRPLVKGSHPEGHPTELVDARR